MHLNEERGTLIKRSRIDDLLLAEGLRWRIQETWLGERAGLEQAGAQAPPEDQRPLDLAFAQKRGHRHPRHGAARGQRDGLSGPDGAGSGQEISGPGVGPYPPGPHHRGPDQAGRRLLTAGEELHLRGIQTRGWRGLHSPVRPAHHGQLGRLPGAGGRLRRQRLSGSAGSWTT